LSFVVGRVATFLKSIQFFLGTLHFWWDILVALVALVLYYAALFGVPSGVRSVTGGKVKRLTVKRLTVKRRTVKRLRRAMRMSRNRISNKNITP
jgi:hypothetical protein